MLEFLIGMNALGCVLARGRRLGAGNPFQIFFFMWFGVFLGFYISRHTYISVDPTFIAIFLAPTLTSLIFLQVIKLTGPSSIKGQLRFSNFNVLIKEKYLYVGQIIVVALMPFVLLKAQALAGGDSVFAISGYTRLRSAMANDGEGYGLLGYSFVFSFIVTSLSSVLYAYGIVGLVRLIFSVLVSLFYVYLSTGRTFILLLFCLCIVPLVLLKFIKFRGLLVFLLTLVSLFLFVASMTSKGVSVDESIGSNVDSFFENLRSYTIAPFVALSELVSRQNELEYGVNSFRFFYALFYALGLVSEPPVVLVKDYSYVPDATNVYTVYEVYFRDFSYIGFLVPSFFLVGHFFLYRKSIRFGGVWVFYYGASIYPLVMQFFQDQYFSLFSQWAQVAFWYWIMLEKKTRLIVGR